MSPSARSCYYTLVVQKEVCRCGKLIPKNEKLSKTTVSVDNVSSTMAIYSSGGGLSDTALGLAVSY